LIEGREVNGYTILKFKRKLVTGDRFDTDIKAGANNMIFSWLDVDPIGEDGWDNHLPFEHFQKSVVLF